MKLTATTFLSLNGIYQAPGGQEEDRTGGFELGGWSFPYADAFLLGRRTYDIFAAYCPW
jgi:hypothetical protein